VAELLEPEGVHRKRAVVAGHAGAPVGHRAGRDVVQRLRVADHEVARLREPEREKIVRPQAHGLRVERGGALGRARAPRVRRTEVHPVALAQPRHAALEPRKDRVDRPERRTVLRGDRKAHAQQLRRDELRVGGECAV
jgi:hypothetical protein